MRKKIKRKGTVTLTLTEYETGPSTLKRSIKGLNMFEAIGLIHTSEIEYLNDKKLEAKSQ